MDYYFRFRNQQLDVGANDLNITFAIKPEVDVGLKSYDQPPHHEVIASRKLSAFGHMFRLITGISSQN